MKSKVCSDAEGGDAGMGFVVGEGEDWVGLRKEGRNGRRK